MGIPKIFTRMNQMSCIVNTVTIASAGTSNVSIGIPTYDSNTDTLQVFYKNLELYETDNYTLNANKTSVDLVGYTLGVGEKIVFKVFKNVKNAPTSTFSGNMITPGSITKDKLATDAKVLIDESTGKNYELGVIDGKLFIREVTS